MSSPQPRGLLFLNYSPPLQLNLSLERIGVHLRKTSVPPVDYVAWKEGHFLQDGGPGA